MKVTYIKLFNNKKNDESVLMKHLRDENNKDNKHEHRKKDIRIFNKKKLKVKTPPFLKKYPKLKEFFQKKIIKKNQVVLVATSLMLVTAGYLNYTNNIKMAAFGDAQLVSTNIIENETYEEKNSDDETVETTISNEENSINTISEKTENEEIDTELTEKADSQALVPNEEQTIQTAVTDNETNTNKKSSDNEYFTKTKFERETMYSQMLETYQKILENNNIPNDQKSIASNEIKNINDKKSAISTIENLIKIKGFEDLAILINGNSVNVVVKSSTNIEPAQVAQIQNIVSRELQTEIEDIHITTHE